MKIHTVILLITIAMLTVFTFIILGDYYAAPELRTPYTTAKHQDDTIRLAYIGDSWAYMHKPYDKQLRRMVEDRLHKPVKVCSYGICGLTSKEIYLQLYDNDGMKPFLQQGFDYAFISAGINDTYKKMSTRYYKGSMEGIIQLLTGNGIRPIILEIPDYDIQKAYDRQTMKRKILRRISMVINLSDIDCKQDFRNALREMISEKGCHRAVDIISFQSWNSHGQKDLSTLYIGDGMHLNDRGYEALDQQIADIIQTRSR